MKNIAKNPLSTISEPHAIQYAVQIHTMNIVTFLLPHLLNNTLTLRLVSTCPLPFLIQPYPSILQYLRRTLTPPRHQLSLIIDMFISCIQTTIPVHCRNQEPLDDTSSSIVCPNDVFLLVVVENGRGADFTIW